MAQPWLLLIYTLPSQPSRYRASVWRELKRLGAVYLRDGVAVLPAREDIQERLLAIVERIHEYEGSGDLVLAPSFLTGRDESLIERFREERADEYREVYHACVRFLRDVLEDVSADEFGFPDVDNLESELARLGRWYALIRERDYFSAPGVNRVRELLTKCELAFEQFASTASERGSGKNVAHTEDVYEQLGGAASSDEEESSELPL